MLGQDLTQGGSGPGPHHRIGIMQPRLPGASLVDRQRLRTEPVPGALGLQGQVGKYHTSDTKHKTL